MTDMVLHLLAAILLFSGVFRIGLWLACRVKPSLRQWSALWAAALILSIGAPLLGAVLAALPASALSLLALSLPAPSLMVPHPLEVLDIPVWTTAVPMRPDGAFDMAFLKMAGLTLYLSVAFVMAVRLVRGRRHVRALIEAAIPCGDFEGLPVRSSDRTVFAFAWSPLFAGRNRTAIFLPALYREELEPAQIDAILRHEAAHIIRRDDQMGLVLRGLLCLAWVSPFAHSLFSGWRQSAELQCDRAVMAGSSPQMRRAYAETLLRALHIMADRVRQYPAAAFSTQRLRNEKMRIGHIMTGTTRSFKSRRHAVLLSGGTVLTVLAGSLVMLVGLAPVADAMPRADDPVPVADTAPQATPSIVQGRISARFGKAYDPYKTGKPQTHVGVDIAAPLGTPIHAPAPGTVVSATDLYQGKPAYGKVVVLLTDDGTQTLFSHLDGYEVEAGQRVEAGELIAYVGNTGRSTGPHVHIETYRDSERVDPMDVWSELSD